MNWALAPEDSVHLRIIFVHNTAARPDNILFCNSNPMTTPPTAFADSSSSFSHIPRRISSRRLPCSCSSISATSYGFKFACITPPRAPPPAASTAIDFSPFHSKTTKSNTSLTPRSPKRTSLRAFPLFPRRNPPVLVRHPPRQRSHLHVASSASSSCPQQRGLVTKSEADSGCPTLVVGGWALGFLFSSNLQLMT